MNKRKQVEKTFDELLSKGFWVGDDFVSNWDESDINTAIDEIMALDDWIPVSADTLPDAKIKQIFAWDSAEKRVSACSFNKWSDMLAHDYITHWKPIEPPSGAEKE